MKASDVMVRDVVTVGPEASVSDVAKILLQNCVNAVPVVTEGGKLIGIVSEGDVLHRPKPGTEARRSWWRDLFDHNTRAAEFTKSHSRKVSDVMTREVVTAKPETPLADIAALLVKHGIKRVVDPAARGAVRWGDCRNALMIALLDLRPRSRPRPRRGLHPLRLIAARASGVRRKRDQRASFVCRSTSWSD